MTWYRPTRLRSTENPRERIIGPDLGEDIIRGRPFYLLTIDEPNLTDDFAEVSARIQDQVNADEKPFTDVFVFSHGWHRHIWQAVAAYDRLVSRLPRLSDQGRTSSPRNRPFYPLYIGLHWHSETGPNVWASDMQSKERSSFVSLVRAEFVDDFSDFELLTDQVFELFTLLMIHGDDSESVGYIWELAANLQEELYAFKSNASASLSVADKVSVLWRCYYEADALKKVTDDQESLDAYRASELNPNLELDSSRKGTFRNWRMFLSSGLFLLLFSFIGHRYIFMIFHFLKNHHFVIFLLLFVLSLCEFFVTYLSNRVNSTIQNTKRASFLEKLNLFIWQLLFSVLLLIWITVSWLLCPLFQWVKYQLYERVPCLNGKNNYVPPKIVLSVSLTLSKLARLPVLRWQKWFKTVKLDGTLNEKLDSQLAFWEMQHQASSIGANVGRLLRRLYVDASGKLDNARLHMVGHSFGGVVVANAARDIISNESVPIKIHSLCLLLPALYERWFGSGTSLTNAVEETVSCIYSKHDSANGLYYPIANQGLHSAGYSGLRDISGLSQMVVQPAIALPRYLNPNVSQKRKQILNIDASLVINQGSLAAGGGHNHIFTDEVIMLIWSCTVGASIHIGDPI